MGYDWSWTWSWGMGLGMLFMGVFWIAVIGGAVWLVTRATRPGETGTTTRGRSAADVLEDRLARGEIDVDEFRSRKAALEEPAR